MSTISITTTQNIEVEYDLASLGERILGYIIDLVIIIATVVVFSLILSLFKATTGIPSWVGFLLVMIPFFFYDLLMEVLVNGQSLGKKIMGIKVISLNGEQASLGQYLIRWLFRFVDFLITSWCCGLITCAATQRCQRLGDVVAGTVLVKTKPRANIHQTLYVPTEENTYVATYPEVINLSDRDIQLVKEVLINVQKTRNTMLALQAMNRIEQVLHITSKQEPVSFLYSVLSDYNNLASKL